MVTGTCTLGPSTTFQEPFRIQPPVPYPKVTFAHPLPDDRAWLPKATFQRPSVVDAPDPHPMKVLSAPVVKFPAALFPIRVFPEVEVRNRPEFAPTTTFTDPVVMLHKAHPPKATLSFPLIPVLKVEHPKLVFPRVEMQPFRVPNSVGVATGGERVPQHTEFDPVLSRA